MSIDVNTLLSGVSFLRDTKSIGDISEMMVALALSRAGYFVAKPFGENCRYDLIIDRGDALFRVQVKTGRLRNGAILFNTYSSHYHRSGGGCRAYTNEIDYFGIYCPGLNAVYLVPISHTSPMSGTLRVQPTKNGQSSQVRWAQPYLIAAVTPPDLIGCEATNGVIQETSVPS
jgi:hypothetical protein